MRARVRVRACACACAWAGLFCGIDCGRERECVCVPVTRAWPRLLVVTPSMVAAAAAAAAPAAGCDARGACPRACLPACLPARRGGCAWLALRLLQTMRSACFPALPGGHTN